MLILLCPPSETHPAEPTEPALIVAFPPSATETEPLLQSSELLYTPHPGTFIVGLPCSWMESAALFPVAVLPSASRQFPAPPGPPLMIAMALPPTLIGFLSQRADKDGNCGRVVVTLIAVFPDPA